MVANTTSFTSPLASVQYGAVNLPRPLEPIVEYVSGASSWTILATILATLVVYDQCV
jgi:C-22 sterol desaturase